MGTAKTDEHGAAEQLYNDEIGGLDDEQQVLEQVIAMMQGLLEEAPSPSPPQITEQRAIDKCLSWDGSWSVVWNSGRALICATVSAGNNGATDQSPNGEVYATEAGQYYGGHSPCK